MHRQIVSALAALLVALSLWTPAGAETKPEDAIKYRHAVMTGMAAHIEALSMIALGMVDHPDHLQNHAEALANAGAELSVLFPSGSGEGDTEALPIIWEEPDKFSAAVAEAEKTTAALRDAAAGGDRKAVIDAFKAAGKACKDCHEHYREEHDHDH
jgi:cytochrome c556